MSGVMSVVYPRPPPTYNTLTNAQRTQLLRTNAKLGQVLGSTPHVMDEMSTFSRTLAQADGKGGRRSVDSSSSYASSSTARSSADSHRPTQPQRVETPHSERAWRVRFPLKRPPILRIGKNPRPLEPIPGSPAGEWREGSSSQSSLSSLDSDVPPSPPSFSIPSEASMRRQKMRRLAKKFGEGVPVHLVFPSTIESDEDDSPVETRAECDTEKELQWEKHTARRSRFVDKPKTSTVSSGRYVVHYQDTSGLHGYSAETFGGLHCGAITTIPEE
ncbi:hypothetical protein BDW22DRAFT_1487083 [Trametopsis cervina]|nr:hypothetical protein BDW22DRAFT_1487083 [Trametopsis cervina]